ncbi:MAG TPA: hypothetical protein VKB95_10920 [Chitinophagaceae bacterium]|nr:hypothetical protein [Chitinophagaceae bacterium]
MEVHAHSHTEKKKFTHYLWEFLMLFLAVFCGFLAENQREHMVEKKREKKFATRVLSDLKEDSAFLDKRIADLQDRQNHYANFLSIMTRSPKPTSFDVLRSFGQLLKGYKPEFITTTYNQMKTSGSLRYINNDDLITALQRYYEITVPKASGYADGIEKVFENNVTPYMIRHFRFQKLNNNATDTLTESEAEIFNRTPESDQEFVNIMGVYQGACDGLLVQQKTALEACKELIGMIKKEYHLSERTPLEK